MFDRSPCSDSHSDCAPKGPPVSAVAATPFVGEGLGSNAPTGQRKAALIDEIIELWRQRQAWHRAEKSLTSQAKAICRRFAGGNEVQGNKLFATAAKGPLPKGQLCVAAVAIAPLLSAREVVEGYRDAIEKRLATLAEQLPVWPAFVKELGGFRQGSLAALVGECGDLSNYSTEAKLWKRLGLAVFDGKAQGRVNGDAAIEQGFNPRRRAVAWTWGLQTCKSGSTYNPLYKERLAHELTRVEEKHAKARARRYATKRLARDIWRAWKAAGEQQ